MAEVYIAASNHALGHNLPPASHFASRFKSDLGRGADEFFAERMAITNLLDKLAVKSEPGLTNTQLLLVNEDLKPGACSR